MADNFLSVTYVDNLIGTRVRTALFTEGITYKSAAFLGTCCAATAVIQNAIQSAGYEVPGTTTDEFIKLATLGEFVRIAFARPDKKLQLPEDYDSSAWMTARKLILSGDAELSLSQSVTEGHGGISATSTTDSPTVFHRADMDVWDSAASEDD